MVFYISTEGFDVVDVFAHQKLPNEPSRQRENCIATSIHYPPAGLYFQSYKESSILLENRIIACYLGIANKVVCSHLAPPLKTAPEQPQLAPCLRYIRYTGRIILLIFIK